MKRGPKPKPIGAKHKGRIVCMDDATRDKAKSIGKGNVSKGVQVAISAYELADECSRLQQREGKTS